MVQSCIFVTRLCVCLKVDANGDSDPGVLMSAQTITSESNSTTTTTHITKVSGDAHRLGHRKPFVWVLNASQNPGVILMSNAWLCFVRRWRTASQRLTSKRWSWSQETQTSTTTRYSDGLTNRPVENNPSNSLHRQTSVCLTDRLNRCKTQKSHEF